VCKILYHISIVLEKLAKFFRRYFFWAHPVYSQE